MVAIGNILDKEIAARAVLRKLESAIGWLGIPIFSDQCESIP
jgi:hypothetical protein